ncbi:hypothetical protein E2542_SST03786 [Spatholobus suberectus]|nr:hypothetical protein E2542_SST03786 [Spatholobus suberectus]
MVLKFQAITSQILGWPPWDAKGLFIGCKIRYRAKPPTDTLRPIISDNACILCLTAIASIELADAYSPDSVIGSSLGKEVHDPVGLLLPSGIAPSGFRPLRKILYC